MIVDVVCLSCGNRINRYTLNLHGHSTKNMKKYQISVCAKVNFVYDLMAENVESAKRRAGLLAEGELDHLLEVGDVLDWEWSESIIKNDSK